LRPEVVARSWAAAGRICDAVNKRKKPARKRTQFRKLILCERALPGSTGCQPVLFGSLAEKCLQRRGVVGKLPTTAG
jgi:hypothetical protein